MNFLLEIVKDDYSTSIIKSKGLFDTLAFGGEMLLIGMLTVFAVLTLLWGCLVLFKIVFHDIPAKREANKEAAPLPETPVAEVDATDDTEIVAVIAAAIAAAESESNGAKFRVVSFRRK